jgi:hypothetical protein
VSSGVDKFTDRLFAVELHLIEKFETNRLAQNLEPLGRPLDLCLRDEFFAHGFEVDER